MNKLIILLVGSLLALSACANSDTPETNKTSATSTGDSAPVGTTIKSGSFVGANGYSVAGNFSIVQASDGTVTLTMHENFQSSNSSNLDIYLSASTAVTGASTRIAKLKSISGRQNYSVTSVGANTHVIIHCVSANIPFGNGVIQ